MFTIILPTLPVHDNHTAQQKLHAVYLVFTVLYVINVSFIKSNQIIPLLQLSIGIIPVIITEPRLRRTSHVYTCVYYATLIPM